MTLANLFEKDKFLKEYQNKLPLKLRIPYLLCKDQTELYNIFADWYKIDRQECFERYGFTTYHFGEKAVGLATLPILINGAAPPVQLVQTYLHEVGHFALDHIYIDYFGRIHMKPKIQGHFVMKDTRERFNIHEKYINRFTKTWCKKFDLPYWSLND